MLKTLVTATAVGGLMLSSAFAQTTPPAPSATTPPAPTVTAPAPSASSAPQFIAAQKSDQWLASKFTGTDVIGPNNEKIGDVNDVLFDKSGKVMAVIVGVGGFLGIGEKNVAIDMAAFQMVPAATTNTGTTGTSPSAVVTDPNDMKLKVLWTKEQLNTAPSFEVYKSARTTTAPVNTGQRPANAPAPR